MSYKQTSYCANISKTLADSRNKMAHRTVLLILLLAVITEGEKKVELCPDEERVLAAESLYDDSMVFAKFAKNPNLTDNFKVGVEIVGKLKINRCSINFAPTVNAQRRGVASIKRLAEQIVLMTTFDEFQTGEPKFLLTLLDLKNCKYHCPLSKYLPASHAIFTSAEDRNTIMLAVIDRKFCWPRNACILTLNYNHPYSEYQAFDIDLVREIRVEPASIVDDRQTFIVRGYNADNIYKMQIYDTAIKPPKIAELTAKQPTVQLKGYDLVEIISLPSTNTYNFEILLCIGSLSLALYAIANGIFIALKRIRMDK